MNETESVTNISTSQGLIQVTLNVDVCNDDTEDDLGDDEGQHSIPSCWLLNCAQVGVCRVPK